MRVSLRLASLAVVVAAAAGAAPLAAAPAFKPVKTKVLRGGDPPQTLRVDVTGLRDLYLAVTVGPDTYSHDQSIWGAPVLIDRAGTRTDLTSLKPASARVGWGELFTNANQRARPLKIAGQTFEKGFWAHAPSVLHFKLDGRYRTFEARVGIDAGAGRNGSVEFLVTNAAPKLAQAGKGKRPPPPPPTRVLPASEAPHAFDAMAAKVLLDRGVGKLLFVRRFTLSANHVYTEYVNSRWHPGGGLCVLDLKTGEPRDLVPSLREGVVNRFDLSWDAKRIVFDFKKTPDAGYRIYEVGVDGRGLRQLTFPTKEEADLVRRYGSRGYHHGTDDLHPCYLPDGGIVFVSTRCRTSILCNGADVFTTKVLYRMDADGRNIRRLSQNPVSEASPAVLPDGRILYHRWEYNDKGAGAVKCLWAMRPDGTASVEIYGNMITDPQTMIYGRPVPGAPDKICFLGTTHWGPNNAMGTVIVLDQKQGTRTRDAMNFVTRDVDARSHAGFHFRVDGKWVADKTGKPGRLFKDPYPLSETLILAAHKPKGLVWSDPVAYDLVLLDGEGRETPLYRDETISCWHPYPLRARRKPVVTSMPLDPDLAAKGLAHCIVTDIYQDLEGVARGDVKYIRILEQTPRPWTARTRWKGDQQGMAHTTVGYGLLGMKAQHGVVPVEEDGSASFYVPADRNIYFQVLDANYMAIQTERTYVNYRPGEKRACVGCHKRVETTPPVGAVAITSALRRTPSMPAAQPGDAAPGRLFDYERQVQPVWNRLCVGCHDGSKETKAGLDLTGGLTNHYNKSYEHLMGRGRPKTKGPRYPLVGVQVDENDVRAHVEHRPPYYFGAHTSVLAGIFGPDEPRFDRSEAFRREADRVKALREQHKDVKLSRAEFIRVANWLDASCQYHGSYWGQKNIQYKDSPYFRPDIPFREAIGEAWPALLRPLYSQALK